MRPECLGKWREAFQEFKIIPVLDIENRKKNFDQDNSNDSAYKSVMSSANLFLHPSYVSKTLASILVVAKSK